MIYNGNEKMEEVHIQVKRAFVAIMAQTAILNVFNIYIKCDSIEVDCKDEVENDKPVLVISWDIKYGEHGIKSTKRFANSSVESVYDDTVETMLRDSSISNNTRELLYEVCEAVLSNLSELFDLLLMKALRRKVFFSHGMFFNHKPIEIAIRDTFLDDPAFLK